MLKNLAQKHQRRIMQGIKPQGGLQIFYSGAEIAAALVEQINARRARQRPKLLYFSLYRGKLFLVRRRQLIVQKPDLIRAIR